MEPRFETFLRVGVNLIVGGKVLYCSRRKTPSVLPFESSFFFAHLVRYTFSRPFVSIFQTDYIFQTDAIRVVYQASELTGIVIRFISYVVTRLFSEGNRICRLTQFSTDPDFTGL